MTRRAPQRLPAWQAFALGALHGPAELLPISSSGHVTIVSWLAGWDYNRLDGDLRKSFEVVLHGGTAAALLITSRTEVSEAVRGLDRRGAALITMSLAPPAIAGYALERPIERYLGTPATIAGGLLAGGLAMALADRAPQSRSYAEATPRDAFWLGVAQAAALVPGVSRNGAMLAAARSRRFTREAAGRLSREAALPVIAGATLLKAVRLGRRGLPRGTTAAFTAGAGTAFASTLGSTRLLAPGKGDRSLLPYAAYRIALASAVLQRLRAGKSA